MKFFYTNLLEKYKKSREGLRPLGRTCSGNYKKILKNLK